MKKKILCLLLAVTLFLGVLPLTVLAENASDESMVQVEQNTESEFDDTDADEPDTEPEKETEEDTDTDTDTDTDPETETTPGEEETTPGGEETTPGGEDTEEPGEDPGDFQTENGAYLISDHKFTLYPTFLEAWSASRQDDIVGLLEDTELSGTLTAKSKITVELNGHKLYRQDKKGPLFNVESELSIYGGRRNWSKDGGDVVTLPEKLDDVVSGFHFNDMGLAEENGTYVSFNTIQNLPVFRRGNWKKAEFPEPKDGFDVIGGLLTGGWNSADGGAIAVNNKNCNLNLYNVNVAGNRGNNGGAIALNNERQTLNLVDSQILYNYAEGGNGGAISVKGKSSSIRLDRTNIAFNLALSNGGAIYVGAEDVSISGNSTAVNPASEDYPANWATEEFASPYGSPVEGETFVMDDDNVFQHFFGDTKFRFDDEKSNIAYNIIMNSDQTGGGGAIYSGAVKTNVSGLNLYRNVASGKEVLFNVGIGGAVALNKGYGTINNCNIWGNFSDDDGSAVYVRFNTDNGYKNKSAINQCTITGNKSSSSDVTGGAVYIDYQTVLALGGKTIIKDNTFSSNSGNILGFKTKDKPSNLILSGSGLFSAGSAFIDPSLAPGSEIHATSLIREGNKITFTTGDYDDHMFRSDDPNKYHFGYEDRNIKCLKGSEQEYRQIETDTFVSKDPICEGSRTRLVSKKGYKTADKKKYPLYEGVVEYPSGIFGDKDASSKFFYSDGYFDNDPKTYDEHLATTSLHLAMAAFYSNENGKDDDTYYAAKSNNIRQFLSDIGVQEDDIYLNDSYVRKPEAFSIGVAIGSKKITLNDKEKTLVILSARGAGYEKEWVSNVTIGDGSEYGGESKGFAMAAEQAKSCLNDYLAKHQIDGKSDDTIFWVAGYSRAGATANLLGARLVDDFDPKETHTFVYTFEAPLGGMNTAHDNKAHYFCIHNVVNDNDLVPLVAPFNMGFHRYGVDHYVPGKKISDQILYGERPYNTHNQNGERIQSKCITKANNQPLGTSEKEYNEQKELMLQQLYALCGNDMIFSDYFHKAEMFYVEKYLLEKYIGSQLIQEKAVTSSDRNKYSSAANFNQYFLNQLMEHQCNFVTDANGAKGYYRESFTAAYPLHTPKHASDVSLEQAISNVAGIYFSLTQEQKDMFSQMLGTLMDRLDGSKFRSELLQGNANNVNQYVDVFMDIVSYDENADHTDAEVEKHQQQLEQGYLFLEQILTPEQMDVMRQNLPTVLHVLLSFAQDDYKTTNTNILGTLIYNMGRILKNHEPAITLAWVRSYDDFYADEDHMIVLDRSEKVTNVSDIKAVVYNTNDGKLEAIIEVRGDLNKGASIFYRLEGDQIQDKEMHPYCGKFTLPDEALHSTWTLHIYAFHDGVQSYKSISNNEND